MRYHLGLIVPKQAEQCRIRVGEDIRYWEEGKSLMFDDTFNHEVWNDTDETRVVLFVDVLRPLPSPWSQINRAIVKAIGYSPFVLDAKRNQEAWEARFRARKTSDSTANADPTTSADLTGSADPGPPGALQPPVTDPTANGAMPAPGAASLVK